MDWGDGEPALALGLGEPLGSTLEEPKSEPLFFKHYSLMWSAVSPGLSVC